MTINYPATLLCDFYKVSHKEQYPTSTEIIYSTWTPRKSRIKGIDSVVAFGFQYFVKEYLIDYFNKNFFERRKAEVVKEYVRVIKFTLGVEYPDATHIAELHDLGYLPIRLRALKEGTVVPMRVPMMTIENTKPEFFWITNYLETLVSSEIWQPMTSATISKEYRRILDSYAMKTVGNTGAVGFQAHDFSFRGMAGLNAGTSSGAGHLLNFVGTDTIPSILFHEKYYNANIEEELVGTSIPATEHSVMSANADIETRDEFDSFKRLITEVYPKGLFSVVSDTYDFWKVIGEYLPRLKDDIMARDGKVVIRPDSGDPVDIICGSYIPNLSDVQYIETLEDAKEYYYHTLMDNLRDETPHGEHGDDTVYGKFKFQDKYYSMKIEVSYNRYDKQYYYIDESEITKFEEFTPKLSELGLIESLWNIFGGKVNDKGYKELDPHIGAIYGDSITLERAETICKRLSEKGFASTNIVFGVGSYTFQYNTRDTFGFAMKATYTVVNGEEKLIFKDPKTDDGTKKSQRGRVVVVRDNIGEITYIDNLKQKEWQDFQEYHDIMEDVFVDGKLVRDETLAEIRARLVGA